VEKQPLEQIPTFAKESIQQKAEDVARQIEIYLRAYPDKTLEDLQNDDEFQKIAIQPVGKTGYTAVSDFNNLVVLFHPNKDLIGMNLESLSADYPAMWDIVIQAQGGYDASGKYKFPDLNNVIKDKYLYIKIIKEKTADGVGLWLAATTALDEYDDIESLIEDKNILFGPNPLSYLIIIVLILLLLAILIKLHIIKFERNTIMVVLSIALLLIIILFIFNASNITKDLKENAINTYFNSLETTASIVDANLKREINNNLNTIQILATRKTITNADLIKIVELDKDFTEVFIIEPDGKISYSSDNSHIGLSCLAKPYFLNVVKGGYLHPLYYSETMGEPSFTFSTFYNGGVLVARMNLNKFQEIISLSQNLGKSGEGLFAYRNNNGDAVFFSERRFTAITESRNIILKEDANIPITQALLGNENEFSDYMDYRGVPVLAITKYINDIEVGLVVKIDKEEALETVSKNINNIWYSTSGIIFAIIIVMILSYFLLTKALRTEINRKTFELKNQFKKSEEQRIATLTVLSDLNAATKDLKSEIEEHERTERKLSDSEKRSSVWLSNSPICTKIVDLDFNLQYMSEQGVKQLKIDDIENFYEKPYPLHFFPDSFKLSMTSSLKEVKKNGNLIKLEGILADMKGNRLWYEHIIVPVNDDSGKLNYLMVVSMDITERKRAEDEIIKLSVAVEQSPATIVITDLGGKIIYANSKFIELTGYTIEETIGQNPRILKSGEHSKEFYKELWETITAGKEWKGQFRNLKKNGTSYWESAYISPVTDSSGKITNFIAIKEDITERKLAETEKKQMEERLRHMEKMDAIGHLAGGIAHDFNNILTGIFGNLLMAKDKLPKDHPVFRFLEESGKALDRATSLTSQLLTFAKGGNPVRADVSIEKLVTETVNFDLSGSKVKPVFKIEKDLWTAKVDQGQIQQVFSNLTINADQAMPNGGKLYISLENSDIAKNMVPELNRGKYIKCTIRDEGTGIAKKQLVQIFDPYFTTKQRGSGLGLATVYSIIKKHGCHITVKSALEKGTTFTFYLPVSDSTMASETKPVENERESVITAQTTGRILVMDDESMICELVTAILNVGGLTVETAPDGNQAIEMYKKAMKDKKPYDVLILDLTIPGGVGGKEAIRELLKINPKVKCIVSSGYANDPIMANYTEYGFKAIVSKPYSPGILLEEVRRVLKD
jgi:PAS domain S-box-containing protein